MLFAVDYFQIGMGIAVIVILGGWAFIHYALPALRSVKLPSLPHVIHKTEEALPADSVAHRVMLWEDLYNLCKEDGCSQACELLLDVFPLLPCDRPLEASPKAEALAKFAESIQPCATTPAQEAK